MKKNRALQPLLVQFPETGWMNKDGQVFSAPRGHFWGALEVLRSVGRGEEADSLRYEYEEANDESDDVQFGLRCHAYEELFAIGWVHIESVRGKFYARADQRSWTDLSRHQRDRLEDFAFRRGCPVYFDERIVIEKPSVPSVVAEQ